jgi:hypothetical protein
MELLLNRLMRLVEEFHDAKEYGSILNITPCDWNLLRRFAVARTEEEGGQLVFGIHGEQIAAPGCRNSSISVRHWRKNTTWL